MSLPIQIDIRCSVVIVTHQSRDVIGDCLTALRRTGVLPAYGARRAWAEVIVVDSGSRDGTPDLVERAFPTVKSIRVDENVGFGAGCNLGREHATGEVVVFLNPDAVVRPGAIAQLRDYLADHPEVAAVGPHLIGDGGAVQEAGRRFPSPVGELRNQWSRFVKPLVRRAPSDEIAEIPASVDWITGACMAVRRDALEAVGGFDPRFFLYWEETDWCLRARRAGWEIRLDPRIRVDHRGGKSAARSGRCLERGNVSAYFRASRRAYFEKHFGRVAARFVEGLHTARRLWETAELRLQGGSA